MQNSIEGFAVGEMLNMMMNNGNKVLSRMKIRCSGICSARYFGGNTLESGIIALLTVTAGLMFAHIIVYHMTT